MNICKVHKGFVPKIHKEFLKFSNEKIIKSKNGEAAGTAAHW